MAPFISYNFLALLTLIGSTTDNPTTANANQSSSMCNCTVSQGENIYDFPFFSSDESVVDFYGYGTPTGSSANTGLETSNGMIMLLYEDLLSGETSLVIILDDVNDGSGGNVDISFNCLPPSAFVAVSDDGGELSGTPPNINGNFSWASCCTDGGVIGGIGCGSTFTINPDVGSGIDVFTLVSGNPNFPEYINLAEIDCPITINCGGTSCCEEAFEIESTIQNATCIQSNNGLIDLNTTCSAGPSFLWSNGSTNEDLMDVPPGTYTVTVTDDGGCMLTESFTVGNDINNPEPSIEGPTVFCVGTDNAISLNVISEYDTYNWSTGDNSQTIDIFGEGTYDVTVTNSFGCIGIASIDIAEEPSPAPEITGPTETCIGEGILLDAGAGFSSYTWSNGVTNQIIYAEQEGTYAVTVTNAAGCLGSTSTAITVNPIPQPFILGPQEICEGDTATLDAEAGFESYLWSTGDESQTIQISESGYYDVSVTNIHGCIGVDIIFVDLIESPLPIINGAISFCTDSIITLTTDLEYSFYEWSNGSESQSISVSTAGIYAVTVSNEEGCEGIAAHEIIASSSDTTQTFLSSCNPLDTGIFITAYENEFGCDDYEILYIEYATSDSVFINKLSCNPQDTGLIVHNAINQFGCDSLTFESTALLSSHNLFIELFSCIPEDTGLVTQNLLNQYGCDSIVITQTLFLQADTTYQSETTCDPMLAGQSEVLQTGANGCDSLIITTTSLLAADTTYQSETTCDPMLVGQSEVLQIGANGCDSLVITNTSLLTSDTTYQSEVTCDPVLVGISETVEIGANGCDSLVIVLTSLIPPDTTLIQEVTCDPNLAGTTEQILNTVLGCDSLIITQVTALESDTSWNFFETCLSSDTGLVVIALTNQMGCDSLIYNQTDLLPSAECILNLDLLTDTISCEETYGSIWVTLLNGTPPYQYQWSHQSGNNGAGSIDQSGVSIEITALPSGLITFDIEDSGGMTSTFEANVFQPDDIDMDLIIDSNYSAYDISCFAGSDGMVSVENINGGILPYSYNWSAGGQSKEQTGLSAGWHTITLSDAIGCQTVDSIFLNAPEEILFELEVSNGDCFTNGNGAISIEQITGGVPPFQYSIDQILSQTNPIFQDIEPGNHILEIEDANGCRQTTDFTITEYIEPTVDLGPDKEIWIGQSVEILVSSSLPFEQYESIYWENYDCPECSSITVTPEITTEYIFVAIDSLGCEIRDEIIIVVYKPNSVFIPNTFSPDFDGINDYFTAYSNKNTAIIHKLQIYDRWGQLVFSNSNFPSNDPSLGWDGMHRGREVNIGVYLYMITIEFEDGETKYLNGDILVLR